MKKTRLTETQIIAAIKQHESGRSSEEICREYGISKPAFYTCVGVDSFTGTCSGSP